MKKELIQTLTATFEGHAQDVCGHRVSDHFVGVNKMVDLGSGSRRAIEDMMFSGQACNRIAQNGDPRKAVSGSEFPNNCLGDERLKNPEPLQLEATIKEFLMVRQEGGRREEGRPEMKLKVVIARNVGEILEG